VSQPATLRLLARADLPFAISTPTVIAAQAALADRAFRQHVFNANWAGRRQLLDGLAAQGLAAQPSQTNFILFDAPVAPQAMREALRREGLVLPQVDQFLRNYALLAVGRPEHNAQVLAYLSRH
jgi:histidinol-phosphate/aromatic aminotransferase/cobyric acid decarboxylase-like protein